MAEAPARLVLAVAVDEAVGSGSTVVLLAKPMTTLNVSATPMTTAKKTSGASETSATPMGPSPELTSSAPVANSTTQKARPPLPQVCSSGMKRKPKLTKKERKAADPGHAARAAAAQSTPRMHGQDPSSHHDHGHQHQHIHCISCGKHLDASEFEAPATATTITCDHGSTFPTCVKCMSKSMPLVQEHDRTNQPVKVTAAWH